MMFLLEMQKGSLVCRACYFFKGKKTGEGRGTFLKKGFPPFPTPSLPSQDFRLVGAARQESLSDGQRMERKKGGCAGSLRIALAPFQRRFEGGMG